MIYEKQCNNAEKEIVKAQTFFRYFIIVIFLLLSLISRGQLTLTTFQYSSIQAIISLSHFHDVIVCQRRLQESFTEGGKHSMSSSG